MKAKSILTDYLGVRIGGIGTPGWERVGCHTGYRTRHNTGYWIQNMARATILDSGYRILDSGYRILDPEHATILDTGYRILDTGYCQSCRSKGHALAEKASASHLCFY